MATLTLRLPPTYEVKENAPATPRRGFWRRWYDNMVEAQMRRARAHVAAHQHLVSGDPVNTPEYRVGLRDSGALPFVR